MIDISRITADRLAAYALFSPQTIKTIADCAKTQAELSYKEWLDKVGMPEVKIFTTKRDRVVPYIDIPAHVKNGRERTLVVHLPMGNSLDPNQLYQVATIAATNPSFRVIAFGNPSGRPFRFRRQRLSIKELFEVAFTKKRRSVIASELEYLEHNAIKNVYHVGYSYGALKALLAVQYAPETVKGLILVDPVAHPRYRKQLLENFMATIEPMGRYVDRTSLQGYFDARKEAAETVNFNEGLRRPINIAIGMMLAKADFTELLTNALKRNPQLITTVAWGGKSELGNDAHMGVTLHNLAQKYPHVSALRLKDDMHAFANDLHLYAAIIFEALRCASE